MVWIEWTKRCLFILYRTFNLVPCFHIYSSKMQHRALPQVLFVVETETSASAIHVDQAIHYYISRLESDSSMEGFWLPGWTDYKVRKWFHPPSVSRSKIDRGEETDLLCVENMRRVLSLQLLFRKQGTVGLALRFIRMSVVVLRS